MALNAAPKLKSDWFTPESERESDNPTRFKYKPLDSVQMTEVLLHVSTESGTITGKGLNLAVQYGLEDWENLMDPDTGKPLKFGRMNIKRVPNSILLDLANTIIEASDLGEAEEKNS